MTIKEIQQGLKNKSFSSREITQGYIKAISSDKLNSFITVNEAALGEAQAADEKLASGSGGPLTGVPIAIKDILVTKDLRTTAASKMLSDYEPAYTATAVARLQEQGAIILGKTNCDEFAMGGSNENSAYGPVLNPHNSERVAGGSSGGSAAAVAAGLAPAALGTDTGGSVRLPASFCGITGFKPTYGRISRYGLIAMASSFDQVGILAHDAYDTAVLLQAMAGRDPLDATSSSHRADDYRRSAETEAPKLTIGLPREYFIDGIDPRVRAVMDEAIEILKKSRTMKFVDISLPHTEYALPAYYILVPSEVSANMARFDGWRYGQSQPSEDLDLIQQYRRNRTSGLGVEVRRRIMIGTYALSAGYYEAYYLQASKMRTLIADDFSRAFNSVDLIMAPTSPTVAFRLGEKTDDPLAMYLSDVFTVSANLAGLPAASLPVGLVDNLPVGMQFIGRPWAEGAILSAAAKTRRLLSQD